jgi:hypothetical protein
MALLPPADFGDQRWNMRTMLAVIDLQYVLVRGKKPSTMGYRKSARLNDSLNRMSYWKARHSLEKISIMEVSFPLTHLYCICIFHIRDFLLPQKKH